MDSRRVRAMREGGASRTFACAFAATWLLSCLWIDRGQAQEVPELELTWHADLGCPDHAWAEASLRDRLGRPPSDRAPRTLHVVARLRRVTTGFQLTLSTGAGSEGPSARGARTLTDARCDELANAAVLITALALEDQARERTSASSSEVQAPPASPPSEPSGPSARAPHESATSPAPRPTRALTSPFIAIHAGALAELGFLPKSGFGPSVSLAWARENLRLELAGYWLSWRATNPSSDGRVSVTFWALRPAACLRGSPRVSIGLELCLGFELGRALSRGSDLDQSREPDWLFRAAWAALRFHAVLRRDWALAIEPGLSVPLGRPRYVSENVGDDNRVELHTPGPVAGRLTLGIERRFSF